MTRIDDFQTFNYHLALIDYVEVYSRFDFVKSLSPIIIETIMKEELILYGTKK